MLRTLVEDPGRWRYGYDLCAELGIQAGSMYPILMRLADRGLLETSWEAEPAPGKPPRHLYRLTGAGRAYAASAAAAATTAAAPTAPTAAAVTTAPTASAVTPPQAPGVSPVRAAAPPRPRLEGA
jgi:PadR family transcriptional regulator PadR